MYSPAIGGRFMQPDPVGYEGGINLYAYVGNDPVNFVDPLGLGAGQCTVVGTDDKGLPIVRCEHKGDLLPGDITSHKQVGGYDVVGIFIPSANDFIGIGIPGVAATGRIGPTSPAPQKPEICARFSLAVYVLNFVGNAADIAALGSIGAAAITSPAPPVAAGFATFAAVAKGVSLAAGVGVTAIHAINGNWGSAATSAGSTAIGQLGGRGLQALGRTEGKQVGDFTAAAAETGAGQAVNAGGC